MICKKIFCSRHFYDGDLGKVLPHPVSSALGTSIVDNDDLCLALLRKLRERLLQMLEPTLAGCDDRETTHAHILHPEKKAVSDSETFKARLILLTSGKD